MRKVFSTSNQVIHIWAAQSQDEGKAGNVSFDGPTLYSYATPIARLMPHPDGFLDIRGPLTELCALHTTASYSVTTTRHQSRAKRASSWYRQFHVPNLGVGGGLDYNRNYSGNMHDENMAYYVKEYGARQAKTYASSVNIDWYLTSCNLLYSEADAYAMFFQLPFDTALFPSLDDTKIVKARARSDRAALRHAAKFKVKETYHAASVNEQVQMYLAGEVDRLPYGWHTHVGAELEQAVNAYSAGLWRTGKSDTYAGSTVLLRLKNETTIETSQGAQFPVSDAKRAFWFIQHCVDIQMGYAPGTAGSQPIHMGPFKIDSISADGEVKAGCHVVEYEEIALMARTLGID